MQSVSDTYIAGKNKLLKYFSSFTDRWSSRATQSFCSLNIGPSEFIFCYARNENQQIVIELCEIQAYDSEAELYSKISNIINQYQLSKVPCSLLMQYEDYQLLITDALPVPANEFQAAIRWKIKDILKYPLQDVVIDSFNLPTMKNGNKKIVVIAAQESKLITQRENLLRCGVNLQFIDINEMALRNIAISVRENHDAVLAVHIQSTMVLLLFVVKDEIYITRSIKISLDISNTDVLTSGIERLATEIQRSFDYFQNLWNLHLPTAVLFSSVKEISNESLAYLSQLINVQVKQIDLGKVVRLQENWDIAKQGKCLLSIGCLLRENVMHAAAD